MAKQTLTSWMVKPRQPFYKQPWYWATVSGVAFVLLRPKKAQAALVKSGPVTRGPVASGTVSVMEAAAAIRKEYPRASPDLSLAIVETALNVGAHPYDLANLIHFESGQTFSAQQENFGCKRRNGPNSGYCAVGLIQFLPSTAAGLFGMKRETVNPRGADKPKVYSFAQKKAAYDRMSRYTEVQQMRYVEQFLKGQARRSPNGKLDTPFKVAMAVFYPVAINKDPDWKFPSSVPRDNKGIYTPRDYTDRKFASAKLQRSDQSAPRVLTA